MQDLNTLLAASAPSGWTLTYAYGIDDAGHIVGYGNNSSGATHAFLLTPALAGDANGDGKVDINDLTIVLGNYNASGATWAMGDFNGDGKVDINDLTIVLGNYNTTASSAAAGLSAVPEPCSLALLAAGVLGLLACAWRKSK